MFKTIFIASLPILTAYAIASPSAPAPGAIFNEGADCTVSWDPDTTGKWTIMNIELMTGPNFPMEHLTTVATVDGTDTTKTSFTYPCPAVDPNSAIFFYQLSSPAEPTNLTWTGRFAIADANGKTTDPPNALQPAAAGGDAKPWGSGKLEDPSSAKPAPSYLATQGGSSSGNSTTVTSASNSTASTSASLTTSSIATSNSASAPSNVNKASLTTTNADSTSGTPEPTAANQAANGAAAFASLDMKTRGIQALSALAGTAFVFVTVF